MKAMILCAGYGTRLGDLTRELPKPMLRLGEHPLLEYLVCHLARHAFNEIAVNLHFMPELIRDYFGDGARRGVRLTYSYEPELLGTAGGVKHMASFLADQGAFLVQYGDMVTNQDFTAMLRFHHERRALATLLVHRRPGSNSSVSMDAEGRIVGFLERPTEAQRAAAYSEWAFSGVTICQPELLAEIPPQTACDLPHDIFTRLTPGGRLFAFPLTGQRCAVDSVERLAQARAGVRQGHFRIP
jgi:mannose-1-phosphate guanylyltransferase/phosphomannomutase